MVENEDYSYDIKVICTNEPKKSFTINIPGDEITENIQFLKEKIFDYMKKNKFIVFNFTTTQTPNYFLFDGAYDDPENILYYMSYFPIYVTYRDGFSSNSYKINVKYGLKGKTVEVEINDNCRFEDLISQFKNKTDYDADKIEFQKKIIYMKNEKINKYPQNICYNDVTFNTDHQDYVCFYGLKDKCELTVYKSYTFLLEDKENKNEIRVSVDEGLLFSDLVGEVKKFLKDGGKVDIILQFNNDVLTPKTKVADFVSIHGENKKIEFEKFKLESGGYTDLNNKITANKIVSNTAPTYRSFERGQNQIGVCKNKNCEAFEREIICPIKKPNFNFKTDKCNCPICNTIFTPITPCFNYCKYWWNGVYKDENGLPVKVKMTPKDAKIVGSGDVDFFLPKIFENDESNNFEWESLLISTSLNVEYINCRICNLEIKEKKEITELECKCLMHKSCLSKFEALDKKCPYCPRK